MPTADFFSTLGLFVAREFLPANTCATIRAEVRSAAVRPTLVRESGHTYVVDENTRRTKWADVSPETVAFVAERLLSVKPELERQFDCRLESCQRPQFLVYRKGDFFLQHRDRGAEEDAPEFSRRRQVSAVTFLNGESNDAAPETYRGGSLTFYGLLDDEGLGGKSMGFPLIGEEGLLVAFPTDLVHEVTPVLDGERYTIATWFV